MAEWEVMAAEGDGQTEAEAGDGGWDAPIETGSTRVLDQTQIDNLLGFKGVDDRDQDHSGIHSVSNSVLVSYECLPMLQFLFETGFAQPSEGARRAFFFLSGLLCHLTNRIKVAGHRDPAPDDGLDLPSKWEPLPVQAVWVGERLRLNGYREAIAARGYAPPRFGEQGGYLPRALGFGLAQGMDMVIHAEAVERGSNESFEERLR